MKIRKKEFTEVNVYDATIERLKYIFNTHDVVSVSFSGGKDSTALLNMSVLVANELGRKLNVVFFDEEAIHPPTYEYVERVAASFENNPMVDFKWMALEFKHRNACSNAEPFWYCWDKEKKDKWVSELSPRAITHHDKFVKGMSFQEFDKYLHNRSEGKIAKLTGIRTQESLRRYRVIAMKKNDAYISSAAVSGTSQYMANPIYDWSSEDVWRVVQMHGWDYNRTYDLFNQTKLFNNFLGQRVCPPFGEEPLRGLWIYAQCFPEMWHKMLNRVDGVATAWRYANTELYSNSNLKPETMSYMDYTSLVLESYDVESMQQVQKTINDYIKCHSNKTKMEIDDIDPHPITGICWKFLARIAIKGDFKGRQNTVNAQDAENVRKKLGITLDEAIKLYS